MVLQLVAMLPAFLCVPVSYLRHRKRDRLRTKRAVLAHALMDSYVLWVIFASVAFAIWVSASTFSSDQITAKGVAGFIAAVFLGGKFALFTSELLTPRLMRAMGV